ncbi:MAG: thioredoxin domain-containing protein [Candidatus Peribacteraceae bacterium]|nr:thioredoxin domain-containing protein [Candidatus Peribacteraceae bacterium]MDD5743018.1 thioredoxin domain-containing protein [Candidatus Peribacteraceae bacterium]
MTLPTPQQETKKWFGITMVLVGVIIGFAGAKIGGTAALKQPTAPTAQVQPTPTAPPEDPVPDFSDIEAINPSTDHIRGNKDATITILEYSDTECPFCARVHPTLQQLLTDYGDTVNWVFRHYPLSFHQSAQKGAESLECAAELGGNDKFWAMIDVIYEKGSDNAKFAEYAKEIGLNQTAFQKCLDSGKYATKTAEMMQSGTKAGIQGTPGNLIINNKTKKVAVVSGAQPLQNFKDAIDGLLK